MAQSQLALYNLAVSIAGGNYNISSVSEQSVPAELCELWYESVRQTVLRGAHWTSAKRYARLTVETERDLSTDWVSTDPAPGWAYSYALPENILAARYLSDFSPFELSYETDKKILSCDVGGSAETDAPILCYTVDVTDPTLWEADLYQAVAYALSAHISMGMHANSSRAANVFQLANMLMLEARANSANEHMRIIKERAARLQERGYMGTSVSPYVHPYGSLFTGTGAPLV